MAEFVNNVLVVRAVGTLNSQTYTMGRPAAVMDMIVIATNAGAGTITLENTAGTPISAAIDPATTDTAAVRPGTGAVWTAADRVLAAGDVLTFTNSRVALNYEAYAYLYPTPGVAE